MACDMVVALGRATVGQAALVGVNQHGPAGKRPTLKRCPGRNCPPDENIPFSQIKLPQSRQVCSVLGSQPAGAWGFTHGLNERRVAMGCAGWRSRVAREEPGLSGPDLVRLVLERGHSAQHAVEVLTDLIGRYGQGAAFDAELTDNVFLVADGREAYVVEAAGKFWAVQECHQARAVCDVALIRQDWCRLAPGLAQHAEGQGWWSNEGAKLDFAGRLETMGSTQPFALKRWGRATLLLEQQNGHLDCDAIRRLLIEHYEDTIVRRRPQMNQPAPQLQQSFSARIPVDADEPVMAWVGLGLTGNELFFPVVLDGELPAILERGPLGLILTHHPAWMSEGESKRWHDDLGRLQQHLDQAAESFALEYAALKRQGNNEIVRRRATSFMQSQAEILDGTSAPEGKKGSRAPQAEFAFVAE